MLISFYCHTNFPLCVIRCNNNEQREAARKIKCIDCGGGKKNVEFSACSIDYFTFEKAQKHGTHETHVLFGWRRWKLIRAPFSAVINSLQIPSVSTQIAAAAVPECCFGNVKHELNHHCKQTTHIVRHTWYGFGEIQCAIFFSFSFVHLNIEARQPTARNHRARKWVSIVHAGSSDGICRSHTIHFSVRLYLACENLKSKALERDLPYFSQFSLTLPPRHLRYRHKEEMVAQISLAFFVYVVSMSSRQTTADGKRMRVFISIFPARLTCTCRLYTHTRSKAGKSTKYHIHIKCVFSFLYVSSALKVSFCLVNRSSHFATCGSQRHFAVRRAVRKKDEKCIFININFSHSEFSYFCFSAPVSALESEAEKHCGRFFVLNFFSPTKLFCRLLTLCWLFIHVHPLSAQLILSSPSLPENSPRFPPSCRRAFVV